MNNIKNDKIKFFCIRSKENRNIWGIYSIEEKKYSLKNYRDKFFCELDELQEKFYISSYLSYVTYQSFSKK